MSETPIVEAGRSSMRIVTISIFAPLFLGLTNGAHATVEIEVDLTRQVMHVSVPSGDDFTWRISSARPGYVTPIGIYRAQHLELMHYSKKYDHSPMPYSIFFRGGYAIHGTYAVAHLGRPASHGCIRLAPANAARLYDLVRNEGAIIRIMRTSPAREK